MNRRLAWSAAAAIASLAAACSTNVQRSAPEAVARSHDALSSSECPWCDDGDRCTVDTCVAGACVHTPVTCGARDVCHSAGACDPTTGACTVPPLADATRCADYDTVNDAMGYIDACTAGVCRSTWESQTTQTQTPAGRTLDVGYDPRGRLDFAQYGAEAPLRFGYLGFGEPPTANWRAKSLVHGTGADARIYSIDTESHPWSYGLVTAIVDPAGNRTQVKRDSELRVAEIVRPDGRRVLFTQGGNLNDRLVYSVSVVGGATNTFTYNNGNVTSWTAPQVGAQPTVTTVAYAADNIVTDLVRPDLTAVHLDYDARRFPLAITNPDGRTTFTRDPAGRVTSLVAPNGSTKSFAYDATFPDLSTATTWTGVLDAKVARSYSTGGWLASESISGRRAADGFIDGAGRVDFTTDADGWNTIADAGPAGAMTMERDALVGRLTGVALGVVRETNTYSKFGEWATTRATVHGHVRDPFVSLATRDSLGRIVSSKTMSGGQTTFATYEYDAMGHLLVSRLVSRNGLVSTSYAYDAQGNRLSGNVSGNATYDAQDRVQTFGEWTYAFTPNGELASKASTSAGTTTYRYDGAGNLVSATIPTGDAMMTTVDYDLDPNGMRVAKRVNGAVLQRFVYDHRRRLIAILSDDYASLEARFVYASDERTAPDFMVRYADAQTVIGTYRLITDMRGSVRLVVDVATGVLWEQIEYDDFGAVVADTNAGMQPFGFAGGVRDELTGLVRFGVRDYDPTTGRWTTKTPALMRDGTNAYLYAGGDPINFADPTGHNPIVAGAAAAVALQGFVSFLCNGKVDPSKLVTTFIFALGTGTVGGWVGGLVESGAISPLGGALLNAIADDLSIILKGRMLGDESGPENAIQQIIGLLGGGSCVGNAATREGELCPGLGALIKQTMKKGGHGAFATGIAAGLPKGVFSKLVKGCEGPDVCSSFGGILCDPKVKGKVATCDGPGGLAGIALTLYVAGKAVDSVAPDDQGNYTFTVPIPERFSGRRDTVPVAVIATQTIGGHTYTAVSTGTVDLQSGSILTLADLILPGTTVTVTGTLVDEKGAPITDGSGVTIAYDDIGDASRAVNNVRAAIASRSDGTFSKTINGLGRYVHAWGAYGFYGYTKELGTYKPGTPFTAGGQDLPGGECVGTPGASYEPGRLGTFPKVVRRSYTKAIRAGDIAAEGADYCRLDLGTLKRELFALNVNTPVVVNDLITYGPYWQVDAGPWHWTYNFGYVQRFETCHCGSPNFGFDGSTEKMRQMLATTGVVWVPGEVPLWYLLTAKGGMTYQTMFATFHWNNEYACLSDGGCYGGGGGCPSPKPSEPGSMDVTVPVVLQPVNSVTF